MMMLIKEEKVQEIEKSQQDSEPENQEKPSQEDTQSGQGQWE